MQWEEGVDFLLCDSGYLGDEKRAIILKMRLKMTKPKQNTRSLV